jgi:hypothetical protein
MGTLGVEPLGLRALCSPATEGNRRVKPRLDYNVEGDEGCAVIDFEG